MPATARGEPLLHLVFRDISGKAMAAGLWRATPGGRWQLLRSFDCDLERSVSLPMS